MFKYINFQLFFSELTLNAFKIGIFLIKETQGKDILQTRKRD